MPASLPQTLLPNTNRRHPAEEPMLAGWSVAVLLLLTLAAPLPAQTEADLKRYFEGKRVTLKIDMPGTDEATRLTIAWTPNHAAMPPARISPN